MLSVLLAVGAAWGAATGSYLGCAAWRLPRRIPLWVGRSHCPGCGQMIPAWRNIPIVAFVAQRGRAACCGGRLARRYLAAETLSTLAGAGAAGGLYAAAGTLAPLLFLALAVVVLAVPTLVSYATADRDAHVGP